MTRPTRSQGVLVGSAKQKQDPYSDSYARRNAQSEWTCSKRTMCPGYRYSKIEIKYIKSIASLERGALDPCRK